MAENKQKKSRGWGFIIVVLILLGLASIIIAGIISFFMGFGEAPIISSGNAAVIPIKGLIVVDKDSGFFSEGSVSSTDTIEMLKKAEENPNIKVIVLEINSGGGSPVATEEIANAIKKSKKPTVSWIREIGASGAYWIASASDYIVADRMSIVGSVGVISSYVEFYGFLNRYNITYQRIVAGKYKDIGDPLKPLQYDEKQILQEKINKIHQYFIDEIASNRKLTNAQVEEVSTAMIYLGSEAKELNLVDELGSKDEITKYIEKKYNLTEPTFVEYVKKKSFWEALSEVISHQSFSVGQGIGSSIVETAKTEKKPNIWT